MAGSVSDVKAFNHDQGASAAVVGPTRSRIRQLVIFGNAAGAVSYNTSPSPRDRQKSRMPSSA